MYQEKESKETRYKRDKNWQDAGTKDMKKSKVPISLLNAIKHIKSVFISLSGNCYTPVDNASIDQVVVLVIARYAHHAQCYC